MLKQHTGYANASQRDVQRKAAASALFNTVGKGPTGVIKSVLDTQRTDGGRRDEIFVDIVERISCTFNQTGYVTASQIDGAIQVIALCCGVARDCHGNCNTMASGPIGLLESDCRVIL